MSRLLDKRVVDEQRAVAVEQDRLQKIAEDRVPPRRLPQLARIHSPQALTELARAGNLLARHHLVDFFHKDFAHALEPLVTEADPAGERRRQTVDRIAGLDDPIVVRVGCVLAVEIEQRRGSFRARRAAEQQRQVILERIRLPQIEWNELAAVLQAHPHAVGSGGQLGGRDHKDES
jgi:hypothetical protein